MIFACEGMAQNAILRKIPKICVFWLFNRLFYSGRNGGIRSKIGHLGAEEAEKTIEHQKIVFRAHFEKIEKNRHFYPKNALKNFQSRFSPADLARTTNRYRSKIHPIGPPKPLYCGLYHQLPTTFPHMLNFRGEISKVHFFRFFPLKWST